MKYNCVRVCTMSGVLAFLSFRYDVGIAGCIAVALVGLIWAITAHMEKEDRIP